MELTYTFTYLPCQACSAKIHCEQCQETIAAALRKLSGVRSAQVSNAHHGRAHRRRCPRGRHGRHRRIPVSRHF